MVFHGFESSQECFVVCRKRNEELLVVSRLPISTSSNLLRNKVFCLELFTSTSAATTQPCSGDLLLKSCWCSCCTFSTSKALLLFETSYFVLSKLRADSVSIWSPFLFQEIAISLSFSNWGRGQLFDGDFVFGCCHKEINTTNKTLKPNIG